MSDEKKTVNLQPKKISVDVNRATLSGFEVDTTDDLRILQQENFNWNDLSKLREELANNVMQFTLEVSNLANNPSIVSNLGSRLKEFTDTVGLFFSDISAFSERVKQIRSQHEHLEGPITNMTDYNNYNRIAFEYHTLCNDLAILVTPTISQLILITSEAVDETKRSEEPVIIQGESLQ